MLFSDSNGGTKHGYFGDSPPLAGLLYYLGATYKRNDNVIAYQNGGTATVGSVTKTLVVQLRAASSILTLYKHYYL